jgi:hypothetical protein
VDKRRSLTPLLRNISVCYGADRRLDPVPIYNLDRVGAMAGWLKKLKDAGEDIERFRVQP